MATNYTYDLTTNVGQVREWLADTNLDLVPNPIWTDEQLTYYLTMVNGGTSFGSTAANLAQILLAAAFALEINANSLARLASKQKIAIFSEDTTVTYASVMKQAEYFRLLSAREGTIGVSTPDNFYQITDQTSNPFDDDPVTIDPLTNLAVW